MINEELRRLCEQVSTEKDPQKLSLLIARMESLLKEEQQEIAKKIKGNLRYDPQLKK